MNNNCKIDFMSHEIRVTKSFYNAAQRVGTKEFDTLVLLQEKLPAFRIDFQEHARPVHKAWNPTYEQIINYIRLNTGCDESAIADLYHMMELAKISSSPYNTVRQWFLYNYPEAQRNSEYTYGFGDAA